MRSRPKETQQYTIYPAAYFTDYLTSSLEEKKKKITACVKKEKY